MHGFAGWVALHGPPPCIGDLKSWNYWLATHGWHARTIGIDEGMLLSWSSKSNADHFAWRMDAGNSAQETGIQAGIWCCEAGHSPEVDLNVAQALMPASGLRIQYPFIANGFAFCHWHQQDRVLTLASDHLGCRPIFLSRQGDRLLFSTDLPLLLETPGLSRRLNHRSIVNLLIAADAGRPGDTLYEKVQRISPGHLWQIGPTGTTCLPLPEAPTLVPFRRPSLSNDAAQSLRESVTAAVHDNLIGADIPAVHLSGGLDSAALACIAARALRPQGRTLLALCSVLPHGAKHASEETDEREYIAHVLAQEPNIKPVWVTMPADEHPFEALPQWFSSGGQAPYNTITHALARLGAAGRTFGVDVVLNGFGGDLFASSSPGGTTIALFQQRRWGAALAQLISAIRQFRVSAIRAELNPLIQRLINNHTSDKRPALITENAWQAFLEEALPHQRAGAARRRLERLSGQMQMAEILRPGHLDLPVSGMCQFMSRTYGQTMGLPLLDPRVLTVALQADPREFVRDGLSRSLFRRSMAGILPEQIRMRPSKGPAFDPALMSHIVANRSSLREWALDSTWPAWQVLERQTFLTALEQVRPAAREYWRRDTFEHVILGGVMGKFLDWHAGVAP